MGSLGGWSLRYTSGIIRTNPLYSCLFPSSFSVSLSLSPSHSHYPGISFAIFSPSIHLSFPPTGAVSIVIQTGSTDHLKGHGLLGHFWSAQQEMVETLLAWLPLKSSKRLQETPLPDERRKETGKLEYYALGTLLLELHGWWYGINTLDRSYCGYYYILQCWVGQGTLQISNHPLKENLQMNDSRAFRVNVLIGHLRTIFRRHWRKN